MVQRRRIGGAGVLMAVFVAASAPFTVSSRGVQPRAAECQTGNGTCCPEEKATCVIGNHQVAGYYYKPEGSCINET